jgi:glycosyltransferase involved in cell wall biosynthesis
MPEAIDARGPLSARKPLDLLLVGPLPYRDRGKPVFQYGGMLYSVWLLQGLERLGHRVRALATGPPLPSELEPGDLGPGIEVDWFAIEFVPVPLPPTPAVVESRRAQLRRALEPVLAERRPDLVLLGFESQGHYAPSVCRDLDLPTVLFAHGIPTYDLLEGAYPPPALEQLLEELSQVDLIVTVSRYLEEILRTLGLTRVQTIRTGIDTEAFRPRPKDPRLLELHGIDGDRFVIGSFSRMHPGKRIADLVASAELVLRSEPHCLYLVVGECPEYEDIVDLVAARGLGDSFRFLGEIEHVAVPEHMALCDVVVLTSEREAFGQHLLEAQASGRPVIATDIPALRELIDDGRTGLLYPVGDIEALGARTLELVRDSLLRRALGEQARAASLSGGVESWIRACDEALAATAAVAAAG